MSDINFGKRKIMNTKTLNIQAELTPALFVSTTVYYVGTTGKYLYKNGH